MKAIVDRTTAATYAKVKQVTIGFNAVCRLLTKRVDAVPAFWNAEGVALKQRGLAAKRVPRRGLRRAAVPGGRARHRAQDAGRAARRGSRRALDAIADGLDGDARAARTRRCEVIAKAAETDDTALVRAQLDAVLPVFADGLKLDRAVLEQWADFDARIGLVEDASRRGDDAFDFTLRG